MTPNSMSTARMIRTVTMSAPLQARACVFRTPRYRDGRDVSVH
jgi:hypothetical protein